MKRVVFGLLLLILCAVGVAWVQPSIPAGVLAPEDPVQVLMGSDAPSFSHAGWKVHALATYDITARVLRKKRYYGGAAGDLVPYDFAVGWGPMSDSSILENFTISQGNRFYFWEYAGGAPPIPEKQIICHSANMHLIPASFRVFWALWWASPGKIMHLTGYLVEATQPGTSGWRSSLSRTDTGNGSCELMWVQSCEFLPPSAASGH